MANSLNPIGDALRLSKELEESIVRTFSDRTGFGLAPLSFSSLPANTLWVLPNAYYLGPRLIFPWESAPCGPLRNRSFFGCTYLQPNGRETRFGLDLKTYDRGLGLSLKLFVGQ